MMTPLIISADDYAQSADIDAGILALVAQARLTAFSCLTLSPRWPIAAKLITGEIQNKADVGLHLDFTQYAQPARQPLSVLIVRSLCHSLSAQAIHRSISNQLDRFEDVLGAAPDYIDGHQHVHQLPQIRQALLYIITRRYAGKLPWLRISRPPGNGFKPLILNLLGAHQLRKSALKSRLRHSDSLLGVYGFDGEDENYWSRLAVWLQAAKEHDGICALMCHPALPGDFSTENSHDPIYNARLKEYHVLASPEFPRLLAEYDMQSVRGNAIKP